MKSILNFYIFISLPFITLMLASRYHLIGSYTWAIFLFIYCLIYHPLISGLRLLANGIIKKNKFWYNFIPGWNSKYFSFLFFNTKGK